MAREKKKSLVLSFRVSEAEAVAIGRMVKDGGFKGVKEFLLDEVRTRYYATETDKPVIFTHPDNVKMAKDTLKTGTLTSHHVNDEMFRTLITKGEVTVHTTEQSQEVVDPVGKEAMKVQPVDDISLDGIL